MLRAPSIAVNDLIPSESLNSNSILPVSKLVVKLTSFSFIVLPLPSAIFPTVASKNYHHYQKLENQTSTLASQF
jgi:hypothetical protein